MYSMVLMMAMSTSPEAAAFGGKKMGCNGCDGSSCHGTVVVYSCHGCNGGSSCHGCKGGGFLGGMFGKKGNCNGCNGGCNGFLGGMFGKKGGCHGCHGGSSCHGCYGGSSCHGCHGGSSCHGCTGGSGCTGTVVPVTPAPEPKKMPVEPKKTTTLNAPASIALNVPADAKVTIDGQATKSTSSVRTFTTPELASDKVYYYTIAAEVVRDGKSFTASEVISVKAGETTTLSLNPGTTSVASK